MEAMDHGLLPVRGVVQPPVDPPEGRRRQTTNQLEFLRTVVLKALWDHPRAWPFHQPVNAELLQIPDYHHVITYAMDLSTVKKRMENLYYLDAQECILDIRMIFFNCYRYNPPDHEVVEMARALEELFNEKLQGMPAEETELSS